MKIIQFTCPDEIMAEHIRLVTITIINAWAGFTVLASDPTYTTQPFDAATVWQRKQDDNATWWVNWSDMVQHIGDNGRISASYFIGSPNHKGQLFWGPIHQTIMLEFYDVPDEDLVAAGYLPEAGAQ